MRNDGVGAVDGRVAPEFGAGGGIQTIDAAVVGTEVELAVGERWSDPHRTLHDGSAISRRRSPR